MQPYKCLYVMHTEDNIATALADLHAGEHVPVLDPNGEPHGELTLTSHVPRFFKVTLNDLEDGHPIIKWGRQIGATPTVGTVSPYPGRTTPAGTAAHFTNFIPTQKLANFWGDHISSPMTKILDAYWESGHREPYPFEFARARVDIAYKTRIFDTDLDFVPGMRELLLPPPVDDDPDIEFHVGFALEPINQGGKLHLGNIVAEHGYAYPADDIYVTNIQNFYRFLKGDFYDI